MCLGGAPTIQSHGFAMAPQREMSPDIEELQGHIENIITNGIGVLVAPVTSIDEFEDLGPHYQLEAPPKDYFPPHCQGQDRQDQLCATASANSGGPLYGTR